MEKNTDNSMDNGIDKGISEYFVSGTSLIFNYTVLAIIDIFLLLISLVLLFNIWSFILAVILIYIPIFLINLHYLRMPHKIAVDGDRILFQSILGKREVGFDEIREVKKGWIGGNALIFKFRKGRLSMFNRIDGIDELLSDIKAKNQAFVKRGS